MLVQIGDGGVMHMGFWVFFSGIIGGVTVFLSCTLLSYPQLGCSFFLVFFCGFYADRERGGWFPCHVWILLLLRAFYPGVMKTLVG